MNETTRALLYWYEQTARVFPWRGQRDPYAVWVSETMLQQTRTETVLRYYPRFMAAFPTVEALASADEQDVLLLWQGLGYYSRARKLHETAQLIVRMPNGAFPRTAEALRALPGVGAYTAGAVASIAFGEKAAAIDGNHARVLCRLLGIQSDIALPATRRTLEASALALMPDDAPGAFNQALMDLGATVCLPRAPKCEACPLRGACKAFQAGDPERLPVKAQRPPKTEEHWLVALVCCGDQVLIVKRGEALLKDMWVFPMVKADTPREAEDALRSLGVEAAYDAECGTASHIFTHRIWSMLVVLFTAHTPSPMPGGQWVSRDTLPAYPFPAAMRFARAALSAQKGWNPS